MTQYIDVIKHILETSKSDRPLGSITKTISYMEDINSYYKTIKNIRLDKKGNLVKNNDERVYLYINQIDYIPLCSCGSGKLQSFASLGEGYKAGCGQNCPNSVKLSNDNKKERGVKVGFGSVSGRTKSSATMLLLYGVDNYSKTEAHKKMMKERNPMFDEIVRSYFVGRKKSPEQLAKERRTRMERRGVINPAQYHYSDLAKEILNDKEKLQKEFDSKSILQIAKYLGVTDTTVYRYLNKHGIREHREFTPEKQIADFLTSLGVNFVQRTRKVLGGQELDIYIPNFKNRSDYNESNYNSFYKEGDEKLDLAIEYCGLRWHSELGGKENNYHSEKMKLANSKGIRLITIFENEWLYNRSVCETRIKSILGKNEKGKGARKLDVAIISNKEANEFTVRYHSSSSSKCSFAVGAYDGDQLVAVMSFAKPNASTKQSKLQLHRFCTDGKNYAGVGGRLLKFAIKEFDITELVSFCDLRWGDGDSYRKMGFRLEATTPPAFWVFGREYLGRKLLHRWSFTKGAVSSMCGMGFDNKMSAWEGMQTLGFDRLWDCGHLKFIWKKQ